MKKTILTVSAAFFLASMILTSCAGSAEKVIDAENNVIEAKHDLNAANEEYLADIENYRKEAAAKIEANEESIKEFKLRINDQKKEAKIKYNEKITQLEQKNTDIKKKMKDYKAEGKEQWETFKADFNRDMDILAKAFKDLTTLEK